MAYQVFQGLGYLFVGAVFEGVAEVFAVDLALPQERAQSRVEDLRGGGEGERPDLRLVPEFAGAGCILRASAAGAVEEDDLGERLFGLHR